MKEAHDALQRIDFFHPESEDEEVDSPSNVLLNGWVMLAEWVDIETGDEWFTMRSGDSTGEKPLARWRRVGFYETAKAVEFE